MPVSLPISKGMKTLIDKDVYEKLKRENQLKWCAQKVGSRFYVSKNIGRHGKIYLHRLIMSAPQGMVVDHIDGNPLNNVKSNLRVCYARDNARNQVLRQTRLLNDFPFKGIVMARHARTWAAQIQFGGQHVRLGSYETAADAAKVYDIVSVLLFGEFARPNFDGSWRYLKLRKQLEKELLG